MRATGSSVSISRETGLPGSLATVVERFGELTMRGGRFHPPAKKKAVPRTAVRGYLRLGRVSTRSVVTTSGGGVSARFTASTSSRVGGVMLPADWMRL